MSAEALAALDARVTALEARATDDEQALARAVADLASALGAETARRAELEEWVALIGANVKKPKKP